MRHRNTGILALSLVCILLLGGVVYTVGKDRKIEKTKEAQQTEQSQSGIVEIAGEKYKRNPELQTILFLGIDQEARADLHHNPGENGQSDSLNLLVLDKEKKTAQIVQISRDSMVDIDIYDINGEKLMTEEGQIALQYAYGDGEEESCRLTSEKVADLMYGVEVDSYVSLTLKGMAVAVDELGGITLTVPEDYTEIHHDFQKGRTVTLDGTLAELYIRSRNTEILDSNNQRMERQAQFMTALAGKLQSISGNRQYLTLYEKLEPYMVTNMTAEEMKKLSEYQVVEEMLKIPGEVVEKEGRAQFIVDNEAWKAMIMELFFIKI